MSDLFDPGATVSPIGTSPPALALRALLAIEWRENGGGTKSCDGCGGWKFRGEKHSTGCVVDEALGALGYPDSKSRDGARAAMREHDTRERLRRDREKREAAAMMGFDEAMGVE